MPGPFPGMDPYLEDPAVWPGVHQRLITYMADGLNTLLPGHYVADVGERLYVVDSERSLYPDVMAVERPSRRTGTDSGGRTALAVASDAPFIISLHPVEVREVFVEILAVGEDRRVVTVIEILSHANKVLGSEGRDLYVKKQKGLLESQAHLVEIDLLRSGQHTAAPPLQELSMLGEWDYLVSLHRSGTIGRYEVWPVPLRQRLPRILIPLADGDPDVALDLQTLLDRCYDEGAYHRRIDYHRHPRATLSEEHAAWAAALLTDHS